MPVERFEDTLVFKCFEEFYYELIRHKQKALNISSQFQKNEITQEDVKVAALNIIDKFQNFFEKQIVDVLRKGGDFAKGYYLEAQYLMVALTDEIFLNLNWPGHSTWEGELLESRLFNTHVAGELFFERLSSYLNIPDPVRLDMAAIYLLCLGLGFKGRYRDLDDQGKIDTCKNRLYNLITHKAPELYEGKAKLFEEAYQHTITSAIVKKLPHPYAWYWSFLAVVFMFSFFSYGLWYKATKDISAAINLVLKTAKVEQ